MRVIKYRAYDKTQKRMLSPVDIFNEPGLMWQDTPEGRLGLYRVLDSLGTQEELELMEWTGLLDKNGREVFEGDRVKFGDGRQRIIVWNEDQAAFNQEAPYSKNQHSWSFTCDDACLCEVIGNIWEQEGTE